MKVIKKFCVGVLASFLFALSVSAASGSINVSTSTKTAAVGSTFTVTVKVSCSEAIGTWQFGVDYDRTYLSLVSGDTSVAGYGDGSKKTQSYTYKFKAIKSGNASVRITNASMVSWADDNNLFNPSTNSVSVTVKTQSEIEASYSKDNYLKSLSVEGYELSPAFDKETTSYSVSVPETVTEIKVNASVNDSRSRLSGTGTVDLSQGTNKVEVVVTAQNGSIKTYTITVDVKDLNPIVVNLGDKKYTIVKKGDLLTSPTGFASTTIKIDDIEVPAFTSELTNLTVIGLKDENGNISMYTYDEDTKTYDIYREIKGTSLTLLPREIIDSPKGFSKVKLTIDEVEYEVLKSENADDFYLVCAVNVENGKVGYYIYDLENHSFVSYNDKAFSSLIESANEYRWYLIATGILAGVLFLLTLILGSKNSKLKKIIKKRLAEVREERKDNSEQMATKSSKKKSKKSKNVDISQEANEKVEENFLD